MARKRRPGFSLLELLVTIVLAATLASSVSVVLRSSRHGWEAHHADHIRWQAAHATLRHLVRHLRQADSILAISQPDETSGSISVQMPDGTLLVWQHDSGQVKFGQDTADNLLAGQIDELVFVGYQADGLTTTTVPGEIQSVRCRVTIQLPRETGGQKTVESRGWLRSW